MPVRSWKVTLEYDGSRYSGWQEQKNARTVMGELRTALEDFLRVPVEMQGAGRTDAGVHASAQVMHLRADLRHAPAPEQLVLEANLRLPADIALVEAVPVRHRFHARHDATSRSYVYQIATRKMAFSKRYVWWVREDLNMDLMAEAAGKLQGRHDFVCFGAPDPARPDESTIVVVESATVERDGDLIVFRITASHFIWRMVRRLAGVLVKLGLGEITMADFDELLNGRCSKRLDVASWTAPSSGLFLDEVRYP